MKGVLFGATGMVGQGVLRECLRDPGVPEVLSIGRRSLGRSDPKLRDLIRPTLADLSGDAEALRGYDATFFCLGVSSFGRTEAEYRRVTYDLTVAAARTIAAASPGSAFVYVSGAGTDASEHGRAGWARVKGATENAVARLPFRAVYRFRPGIIRPLHRIRSKTRGYRVAYAVLRPLLWLVRRFSPNAMTTTEAVGRAMLRAVRDGGPSAVVDTREINRLGAAAPHPGP